MEPVAIATVVAVTGKAYARNADGELREIRPGDVLMEGETVVTPDGATVELSLSDGSPIVVADMPELTLTPDLVADTAPGADESAVQDETVEQVLAALESGEDLSEVLDATAAGPGLPSIFEVLIQQEIAHILPHLSARRTAELRCGMGVWPSTGNYIDNRRDKPLCRAVRSQVL